MNTMSEIFCINEIMPKPNEGDCELRRKIFTCFRRPYCGSSYILSLFCDTGGDHNNECAIPSDEEINNYNEFVEWNRHLEFDYGKLLELKEVYEEENVEVIENDLMTISQWTYTGNKEGVSSLYAECLQISMIETVVVSICVSHDRDCPFYAYLPASVKNYLNHLPMKDRCDWLTKLNYCYVRLFLNLMKGYHIDYCIRYDPNNYYKLCNCVGDEFVFCYVVDHCNDLYEERIHSTFCDCNGKNLFWNGFSTNWF